MGITDRLLAFSRIVGVADGKLPSDSFECVDQDT